MKRPACTRAWQAEALEDGRLSGAERASFERHAASCAECARELRALVRLRQGAEWLPASSPTPLEHRRQRQALLRRASELCQRAPAEPRRRTFAAFVLSGALMAALFHRVRGTSLAIRLGSFRCARRADLPARCFTRRVVADD